MINCSSLFCGQCRVQVAKRERKKGTITSVFFWDGPTFDVLGFARTYLRCNNKFVKLEKNLKQNEEAHHVFERMFVIDNQGFK